LHTNTFRQPKEHERASASRNRGKEEQHRQTRAPDQTTVLLSKQDVHIVHPVRPTGQVVARLGRTHLPLPDHALCPIGRAAKEVALNRRRGGRVRVLLGQSEELLSVDVRGGSGMGVGGHRTIREGEGDRVGGRPFKGEDGGLREGGHREFRTRGRFEFRHENARFSRRFSCSYVTALISRSSSSIVPVEHQSVPDS
jgi:hypothetical protein